MFTLYLVEKKTGDKRWLSEHKREKDAHKMGQRSINAKSPKLFEYIVEVSSNG